LTLRVTGLRLFLLIIVVGLLTRTVTCGALTEDEVRDDLSKGYEAVARAEGAGGDVSELVLMLDKAARIIPGASEAQLSEARDLIARVESQAPLVEAQGGERLTSRLYVTVFALIVIALLGVITWVRGSRWILDVWLRAHRGWRVERI
jgi:hypothetical protein